MVLEVIVTSDYEHMSRVAADILIPAMGIATLQEERMFNLGLATGNSPKRLYSAMVNRQEEYYAPRIRAWILDEYLDLPKVHGMDSHPKSYKAYIIRHLASRIDPHFAEANFLEGLSSDLSQLKRDLLDGSSAQMVGNYSGKAVMIAEDCSHQDLLRIKKILGQYSKRIYEAGGIDWQIVGTGSKGHLGFQEKGIPFEVDDVILVKLDEQTIIDAVKDNHFPSREEAPQYTLSLSATGVVNLCKNVLVLASGSRKTEPVSKSLLGGITPDVPISILQRYASHNGTFSNRKAIYVVDQAAAAGIIGYERELANKGITVQDLRG